MRMFPACFECFLQSGKPSHTLRAHGTSVFKLDSIELDDVNEAEEDLPAEWGGAAAGRRERKEEKRGRRERKEEVEGDPVVPNHWRFKDIFVNRTGTKR